jgi:transposase InsO family protein
VAAEFGGRRFNWDFLQAAVSFPIIGSDFLTKFNLILDFAGGVLSNKQGNWGCKLSTPAMAAEFSVVVPVGFFDQEWASSSQENKQKIPVYIEPVLAACQQPQRQECGGGAAKKATKILPAKIQNLVQDYRDIFSDTAEMPAARHGVLHHISTSGQPVSARYRRLDAEKLEAARREFQQLEDAGIIRRSKSQWASPLHMVRKADGSWRPCGDYRRLNAQTTPDRYTCPNIGDLTARLAGRKIFSKLDLRKGYHQVPVRPEDVEKTAVITPFGLYEYIRMPFGLRNAGQTFQRLMDQVLRGLEYCFVYLDDILIASSSPEEHARHLEAVFGRIREAGLLLNREKCVFAEPVVDFLGHQVSQAGIAPLQSRVEAVRNFPKPASNKQLMSFLGMLNFYRRFLPRAAQVLKPLTDVLRGGAAAAAAVTWSEAMDSAFEAAKKMLADAACLAHPEPHAQLSLAVDASNTHIGAVLQQDKGRGEQPLAFFSRKLDATQAKYSTFDRELLACHEAVRHFRWSLEGREFFILTDHRPLTFALTRLSDAWSARQQRQLSAIAEYTTDIRHVPGAENVVADALSRPPEATSGLAAAAVASVEPAGGGEIDYVELAADQEQCEQIKLLAASPALRILRVKVGGVNLLCDMSTASPRPLVPEKWRRRVFRAVHELAHPGVRATRRLITSRFLWRGCAADIAEWCRCCMGCARGKPGGQLESPPAAIPIPKERFSHVHADLVGPLPVSANGYSHLLTVVDRTTRWPEAFPLADTSAASCAAAFLHGWVARYGAPAFITTDRGAQFTSACWADMCSSLGAVHITTSAYHPQSNGIVERLHRQIKEALRSRGGGNNWLDHLVWVMLGIRAAPKELAGVSAAEAVFGAPLTLPGQLVRPPEPIGQPVIPGTTPEPQQQESPPASPFVLVRRPGKATVEPIFDGPFEVLETKDKTVKVNFGSYADWVAKDRVKCYSGQERPEVQVKRRRGRPRKK